MAQDIENTKLQKTEYRKNMNEKISKILTLENGNNFNNMVFRDYIIQKGAKNLVKALQEKGYKFNTRYKGRNWNTKDIRKYVLDSKNHDGVNEDLVSIVCLMVNYTGKANFEQRLHRAMNTLKK